MSVICAPYVQLLVYWILIKCLQNEEQKVFELGLKFISQSQTRLRTVPVLLEPCQWLGRQDWNVLGWHTVPSWCLSQLLLALWAGGAQGEEAQDQGVSVETQTIVLATGHHGGNLRERSNLPLSHLVSGF